MNILLINVPSRKGRGGFMLPIALLYVGGIIERCGHKAEVLDLYLDDVELKDFDSHNFNKIFKAIENFKPSIVGYGGIATSYGRTKKLSMSIKEKYPEIFQIAGGALSSVYELLLTKTGVDLVFHGETEVKLPNFLIRFKQKELFYDLPGISYLLNGEVVKNNPASQIEDLDMVPVPAYHLVEVEKYLEKNIGNGQYYLPIMTSRGCTHRCLFCYRHLHGIRQHSVTYVMRHIKFLRETYNIKGFLFCDELFNSQPEWVTEFCDALEDENLNIFYIVGGARIDKINETILCRLKETGCIEIGYGHESGSDMILKEYRKGVTSKLNKDISLLTKKIGINCPVQLVIGSHSETLSTIYETIQLLKDLDAYQYSLNYLIPLPETPIWEYVKKNRLVEDVEMYLDKVAELGGKPILNLTKMPERIWKNLHRLIYKEVRLHYYRKKYQKFKLLFAYVFIVTYKISPFIYKISPHIPSRLKRIFIPKWIKLRIAKFLF